MTEPKKTVNNCSSQVWVGMDFSDFFLFCSIIITTTIILVQEKALQLAQKLLSARVMQAREYQFTLFHVLFLWSPSAYDLFNLFAFK